MKRLTMAKGLLFFHKNIHYVSMIVEEYIILLCCFTDPVLTLGNLLIVPVRCLATERVVQNVLLRGQNGQGFPDAVFPAVHEEGKYVKDNACCLGKVLKM